MKLRSIFSCPEVSVLVLGGIFAYYANRRERQSGRREAYLSEVNSIAGLELSAHDALVAKLKRLCEFFRADACVLLCKSADSSGYVIHRLAATSAGAAVPRPTARLSERAAQPLLELPDDVSLAWSAHRPHHGGFAAASRRLANLLEASHFATVPYRRQQELAGRLFVISGRHPYTRRQSALLRQIAVQIGTVVGVHALLDELKLTAARAERSRISRDIHDTTIQPYIALKFGIEALYRRLDRGSPVAREVKELLDMSSISVEELRTYVAQLQQADDAPPEQGLPKKLRAQAERYRAFWGIDVELRIPRELDCAYPSPGEGLMSERLAAEAYQAACEALSNIRRHTRARRAFVALQREDGSLVLEVGNERCGDSPTRPFTPRSIADRASALGGNVEVMLDAQGHDVVQIRVPLRAQP
jgi:signal transduction histidine kinase